MIITFRTAEDPLVVSSEDDCRELLAVALMTQRGRATAA
jgi:hypothetical protein